MYILVRRRAVARPCRGPPPDTLRALRYVVACVLLPSARLFLILVLLLSFATVCYRCLSAVSV